MDNNPFEKSMTIVATDADGKEKEFEVLLSFISEETGKTYIVFTDNSVDEDGNTPVYAYIVDTDSEELNILPIETDMEWALVENALNALNAETEADSDDSNDSDDSDDSDAEFNADNLDPEEWNEFLAMISAKLDELSASMGYDDDEE